MDESQLSKDLLTLGLDAENVTRVVEKVQTIKLRADAVATVGDLNDVYNDLLRNIGEMRHFDAQSIAKMKFVIASMLMSDLRKMLLKNLTTVLSSQPRDESTSTILNNLIHDRVGGSTSHEYSDSDKELLLNAIGQVVQAMKNNKNPNSKTGGKGRSSNTGGKGGSSKTGGKGGSSKTGGKGGRGGEGRGEGEGEGEGRGEGATKRKTDKRHAATSPGTQEEPAQTTSEDRDYTRMSNDDLLAAGVSSDDQWVSAWYGETAQVAAQRVAQAREQAREQAQ